LADDSFVGKEGGGFGAASSDIKDLMIEISAANESMVGGEETRAAVGDGVASSSDKADKASATWRTT